MRPAFLGMNTARSALFVNQQQLDVTAHNIANAAVAGYSRQRLDVTAGPDLYGLGQQYPGAVGEGVRVEQLQRLRNQLLEKDYRRQSGEQAYSAVQKQYLSRLEGILGDLDDTGLNGQLEAFFDAWQEVSQRPDDLDLRRVMLEKANTLAGQIREVDAEARQLQQDANDELRSTVGRINTISERLSALNTAIAQRSGGGDTPADLLDERDRLLLELSEYARIQVREMPSGKVEVQIDGKAIVDDERAHAIKLEFEPDFLRGSMPIGTPNTLNRGDLVINGVDIIGGGPALTLNTAADYGLLVNRINQATSATGIRASVDPAGQLVLQGTADGSAYLNLQLSGVGLNVTGMQSGDYTLTSHVRLQLRTGTYFNSLGGKLEGLQQARNQEIPTSLQTLNALSAELIRRVNDIHSNAFDLNRQSGRPFFTGTHPGNIQVAGTLLADPSRVAAAATAAFPPGDGSQALAIYQLRSQLKVDANYQLLITRLGTRIQTLEQDEERQGLMLEQLDLQRQSEAGVNLDEELANMLQYQRSFSAAARVMTTLDEMLNQIVNGLI